MLSRSRPVSTVENVAVQGWRILGTQINAEHHEFLRVRMVVEEPINVLGICGGKCAVEKRNPFSREAGMAAMRLLPTKIAVCGWRATSVAFISRSAEM